LVKRQDHLFVVDDSAAVAETCPSTRGPTELATQDAPASPRRRPKLTIGFITLAGVFRASSSVTDGSSASSAGTTRARRAAATTHPDCRLSGREVVAATSVADHPKRK
jgi:hypothetical protein